MICNGYIMKTSKVCLKYFRKRSGGIAIAGRDRKRPEYTY